MTLIHLCIECPVRCRECRSGGSSDGGLPINANGVCEHFCSIHGYCGEGSCYETGIDCRGCKSGNSSISQ